MATYTGDNIISAHGELWKLYREVIAKSIQFPDFEPITKNTKSLLEIIDGMIDSDKNHAIIPITDLFQKYSLANVTESILGVNFKVLEGDQSIMHQK